MSVHTIDAEATEELLVYDDYLHSIAKSDYVGCDFRIKSTEDVVSFILAFIFQLKPVKRCTCQSNRTIAIKCIVYSQKFPRN